MATALELISNQGNADLGFGSHPEIPVGTNTNLDSLAEIGNSIMLQNMAQNKHLFDQKVKDRDELMKNIHSGDIKVGDLLEEDMPYVKEGLDNLDTAFFKMVAKGRNDINAQAEYRKAVREATDRVTQAQGRKLFHDEESLASSTEKLPRKQEARKQHLEKTLKSGFWTDTKPYQQTQDLDIAKDILPTAAQVSTQFRDPNNPLFKITRTAFDYGKTLANNRDLFINDADKRNSQLMLREGVEKEMNQNPEVGKKIVDDINDAIARYNDERGLEQGDKGYVKPLNVFRDRDGIPRRINERADDFAAKYTLAHQKPFTSISDEFDKGLAAYKVGMARIRPAEIRARAYADLTRKKIAQMNDQEKQVLGFWKGLVGGVREQTLDNLQNIIPVDQIPEGYTYIGGVGKKGEVIQLKPKVYTRPDGSTVSYYGTRFTNATNGDIISKAYLDTKFKEYRKKGGRGNYESYVQNLINEGVVDMQLEGENGTANFDSALQSARAFSNKIGSGKEDPVYGDTEDGGDDGGSSETVIEETQSSRR